MQKSYNGLNEGSWCSFYEEILRKKLSQYSDHFLTLSVNMQACLNPIALRKAKIEYNFGLSDCNGVNLPAYPNLHFILISHSVLIYCVYVMIIELYFQGIFYV